MRIYAEDSHQNITIASAYLHKEFMGKYIGAIALVTSVVRLATNYRYFNMRGYSKPALANSS
ncbi:hypothetical protein GCM10007852_00030 [Agaribacter marinus]|uniref:Uncharacterized protein n=1 Tax=Agaribacter marinus TaxID=1431249 RepID=A0AA37WIT9_9ALTE|nr:hypothetical protein GCM10007852_00030 [Agaribacter marinus]